MNTSVFAVDFFDAALWENKLNFAVAQKHKKDFFWGIFNSCIEGHHDESVRIFVFTLRQWRRLLNVIGPAEIRDVMCGMQRLVTVKTTKLKFIKNISLKIYCVVVKRRKAGEPGLKNQIEVKRVREYDGSGEYFLSKDFFEEFEDNDDLYEGMDIDEFIRQRLKFEVYEQFPKELLNKTDPFWLYYFSSQKRPDDPGRGIRYCPVETTCPWIPFLNRMQGTA